MKGQFVKLSKDAAAAEAQQQGSNGGALTTAASPNVTCDGGAEGGSAAEGAPPLREAPGEGVVNMDRDLEYEVSLCASFVCPGFVFLMWFGWWWRPARAWSTWSGIWSMR